MSIDHGTWTVLFVLILLLFGLGLTIILDSYLRKEHRYILLNIVILCVCLIMQNIMEHVLCLGEPKPLLRTLVSIFGYCVRPVFLVLFLRIVNPEGKSWIWWLLVAINAAINCTALFSGVCFQINENNHYISGPLCNITLYISAVLFFILIMHLIKEYKKNREQEKWIPVYVVVIIIVSVVLDYCFVRTEEQSISFLTAGIIVGTIFFYIWLHLQFVREHERDLMAEQRIQIMMTQIQPHFLFNTIATFKALCKKEPRQAAALAHKFGIYLRQNLDNLDTNGLIPFPRELEHTRLYAEIEMVRFENVRVEYDIKDTDFSVPPLTVQPLVENSIRHGVRVREEGMVCVHAFRESGYHVIVIEDNGVGFEPESLDQQEGTHIGLQNVRERVESMCHGTLTIESNPEKGTFVTIRIPEKEEQNESNLRRR